MRFFKSLSLLAALTLSILAATASNGMAQQVCPGCGQVHGSQPAVTGFQAQAQMEAQQMAARRYKGHVRGTVAGVRFSGVGWSSSSPNAPTCTPGNGMRLVADAVARGSDGWYRVRYWR
jgi:hypothetical protein